MARGDAPVLTPELLRSWPLPVPDADDDKTARGTALVVGGAASTPGAVLLAGLAALRMGAGRLQLATVPETATSLGVAVPEAMVLGLDDLGQVPLDDVTAVLIGPGLLGGDGTDAVVHELLPRVEDRLCVIDAHALGALPDDLPPRTVLTPNLTELATLYGGQDDDVAEQALRVAASKQAVVATQGWAAAPDGRLWRNETGDVGLATSGSGDVFAGAVLGLLARGSDPCQAACWALHVHGAAGQRLAAEKGRIGFLARELLDALPSRLQELSH